MPVLKRVSESQCMIEKSGSMHVPGKVYLTQELESVVDTGAIRQVANVAGLPGIIGASIAMPDIHIGYGFPIGGVAAFDAKHGLISPGGIGFDINCSVRVLRTNLTQEQVTSKMPALLKRLFELVPTGTGCKSDISLSSEELDAVLIQGGKWALAKGFATADDIEKTEERGCLAGANPSDVSHDAKSRGKNQLGTLGAGNHFLEVQVVDAILDPHKAHVYGITKPGQVVVMIHCGSRGLGHQVCTDYLKLFQDEFPSIAKSLPERNLMYAPIDKPLAKKYLSAMAAAANFAWCNKLVISARVRQAFKELFPDSELHAVYDVSHNIAKQETHVVDGVERTLCVHRKGATRAFPPGHPDVTSAYRDVGQPVLIPGSMGTASYILAGTQTAMDETFGSCCHGAGRAMSRTQALADFTGERVKRDLAEHGIAVHVRSIKGLAEEAPAAYKDVDLVIDAVAKAGLAVPVVRLRPIGVVKG